MKKVYDTWQSFYADLDRKIPKAITQIEGTKLFSLVCREKKFCKFGRGRINGN